MSFEVTITLDSDQTQRLDLIAQARQETTADIVGEAVAQYLGYDAWFRTKVQEGIASLDRGEGRDLEDVARDVRAAE